MLKKMFISSSYLLLNFTSQGQPIDLFLKISVLQANFCWLGDVEKEKFVLVNSSVSQVAGCRCTLLVGNSSISLAGSEEQMYFSQQCPKILKVASQSFIHTLLLFLGLFLKISRWVLLTSLVI